MSHADRISHTFGNTVSQSIGYSQSHNQCHSESESIGKSHGHYGSEYADRISHGQSESYRIGYTESVTEPNRNRITDDIRISHTVSVGKSYRNYGSSHMEWDGFRHTDS